MLMISVICSSVGSEAGDCDSCLDGSGLFSFLGSLGGGGSTLSSSTLGLGCGF